MIAFCEDGAEYEGAALIGADGLWSPTRAAVIGDGPPRMAGHFVYRGVVPIENIIDRSHQDSMIIYVGPNLHLVQYRLRGGTVMNNVATIASYRYARGEKDCGGPDELAEMFARCDPRVRQMLDYVGRERNWVLHDRPPVSSWTKGNVTLLGDAAHPMLQYLAQGACMAIEDAVVLAAKVGAHGDGFQPRLPRLPAGALLPHRARADHRARLRRHHPRRRRRARAAQPPVRAARSGFSRRSGLALPGDYA